MCVCVHVSKRGQTFKYIMHIVPFIFELYLHLNVTVQVNLTKDARLMNN